MGILDIFPLDKLSSLEWIISHLDTGTEIYKTTTPKMNQNFNVSSRLPLQVKYSTPIRVPNYQTYTQSLSDLVQQGQISIHIKENLTDVEETEKAHTLTLTLLDTCDHTKERSIAVNHPRS